MFELLIVLIIGLLIVGIAYWIAAMILPHPIPIIVAVVGLLIVLLVLLNGDYSTCTGHRC